MSLDFEDSNSGFEMISSQPDKPSEKPSYKSVPEDQVFRFKFISQLETKPKKVCYKLRKGLDLPYVTDSGGMYLKCGDGKQLKCTFSRISNYLLFCVGALCCQVRDLLTGRRQLCYEASHS